MMMKGLNTWMTLNLMFGLINWKLLLRRLIKIQQRQSLIGKRATNIIQRIWRKLCLGDNLNTPESSSSCITPNIFILKVQAENIQVLVIMYHQGMCTSLVLFDAPQAVTFYIIIYIRRVESIREESMLCHVQLTISQRGVLLPVDHLSISLSSVLECGQGFSKNILHVQCKKRNVPYGLTDLLVLYPMLSVIRKEP